jgi:hypothetical protein
VNWLTTDVTVQRWIGLLPIAVSLVMLAIWLQQMLRCHRWHGDIDDAEYAEWDDDDDEAPSPADPAESAAAR